MTHTQKHMDAHKKFHEMDGKFNALWLELGKLDALADLIDLRTDNKEWQASKRAQFAVYLCCGLITKVFQDFSDVHDEYQTALTGLELPHPVDFEG